MSLHKYIHYFGVVPTPGQPVGYIEVDGIAGYGRGDEAVHIGDELEEGVPIIMKDGCNEWYFKTTHSLYS